LIYSQPLTGFVSRLHRAEKQGRSGQENQAKLVDDLLLDHDRSVSNKLKCLFLSG